MGWKEPIKRLLRHRPSPMTLSGVDVLERDWTFRRSVPDGVTRIVRLSIAHRMTGAPAHAAIIPIVPRARWIVYFIYLPSGGLSAAHRFTLERLRASDSGLAVICATPSPADVPDALIGMVDALYWKALPGFDFSAYALAMTEVLRASPGADILILNDSVFGPFVAVDDLWQHMRWDLTGFTASAQIENHIQSYAFHIRGIDAAKVDALRSVMPAHRAFNDYRGAVYGQESRLAKVASRSMTVGALWYADGIRCGNPSIFAALPLLDAGFPFLKRALLSKNDFVYPRADVMAALAARDHPLDDCT